MIVAGLLLTRLTRRPSARSTRQAWVPESSISAAWPMRMGPEPISITCSMSVRLGIALGLHQVDEPLEERRRVVRTGRRLGVELDAERGGLQAAQALDDVVVEADVAHLDRPVRGVGRPVERRVDGEAVVVAGHPHGVADPVEHRLVQAAVAEAQFVGAQAERAAEDLVAETDAEQRPPGVEHALDRL